MQPERRGVFGLSVKAKRQSWIGALGSPVGPASPRRKRNLRLSALVVSLSLHAIILLNFFATTGGAPFTGGAVAPGRDEPAFIVTLAGAKSPKADKPTPEQQLDHMLAEQRANPSPVVVDPLPPSKPMQSLTDLLAAVDKAHGGATPNQPSGKSNLALGGTGADAHGARETDQGSKTPHAGPKPAATPGAAASSGALWGQIEPCWSKLPAASGVPVTLEITLNGEGRIAIPPRIVRPNTEPPNERRLIAEARALAAVSACVPYKGPLLGTQGKVFRVDFVRSR